MVSHPHAPTRQNPTKQTSSCLSKCLASKTKPPIIGLGCARLMGMMTSFRPFCWRSLVRHWAHQPIHLAPLDTTHRRPRGIAAFPWSTTWSGKQTNAFGSSLKHCHNEILGRPTLSLLSRQSFCTSYSKRLGSLCAVPFKLLAKPSEFQPPAAGQ